MPLLCPVAIKLDNPAQITFKSAAALAHSNKNVSIVTNCYIICDIIFFAVLLQILDPEALAISVVFHDKYIRAPLICLVRVQRAPGRTRYVHVASSILDHVARPIM